MSDMKITTVENGTNGGEPCLSQQLKNCSVKSEKSPLWKIKVFNKFGKGSKRSQITEPSEKVSTISNSPDTEPPPNDDALITDETTTTEGSSNVAVNEITVQDNADNSLPAGAGQLTSKVSQFINKAKNFLVPAAVTVDKCAKSIGYESGMPSERVSSISDSPDTEPPPNDALIADETISKNSPIVVAVTESTVQENPDNKLPEGAGQLTVKVSQFINKAKQFLVPAAAAVDNCAKSIGYESGQNGTSTKGEEKDASADHGAPASANDHVISETTNVETVGGVIEVKTESMDAGGIADAENTDKGIIQCQRCLKVKPREELIEKYCLQCLE